MSRFQRLSLCGTARLAFNGTEGIAPDVARYEEFLDRLRKGVKAFNIEDDIVQVAARLVSFAHGADPDEKEALTLLALCSLVSVRQGNTMVPLGDPKTYLVDLVRPLVGFDDQGSDNSESVAERILPRIEHLLQNHADNPIIGGAGEYKPLLIDADSLYLERMFRLERVFCERLRELAGQTSIGFSKESVEQHVRNLNTGAINLTKEQKHAITVALTHPVSIISGGPGTGKTSIVVSIIRVLQMLGVKKQHIILAAPTGKAAQRMTESVHAGIGLGGKPEESTIDEASTLHRLLQYSPSRDVFKHNEINKLTGKVIIVDEASMIDLYLMERLMSALPQEALLILIGDADQLPSVDAGAVLGELMQFEQATPAGLEIGIVRLTESFRMRADDSDGRQIYQLAEAIKRGAINDIWNTNDPILDRCTNLNASSFSGARFLDTSHSESAIGDFCKKWYETKIIGLRDFRELVSKRYYYDQNGFSRQALEDLTRLFDHFESFKILCATNVFSTGTWAVNRIFHGMALEREGFDRPVSFAPGEPVMMEQNDYVRNIFNGDQGIVLRVAPKKGMLRLMAIFRRGTEYVAYPVDSLRGRLSLAYAITVHRSQGSEYRSIALILPEQHMKILTQEILYTAVTRAKTGALVIGRPDVFSEGVRVRVQRACGIGRRISVLQRPGAI